MRRHCLALALAAACAAPGAGAAEDDRNGLIAQIKRRTARVEPLEQRNQTLERALASDRIGEREPELATRPETVETQAADARKAAGMAESLVGIEAGFALTTVAQKPAAALRMPGTDLDGTSGSSRLNTRADVTVMVPLANIGDTESKVFAHVRIGQGEGLSGLHSFSNPNATVFSENAVAVLGEAWYQATIPLPSGGFAPRSTQALEVNIGKMDPFVFFDQNEIANDEARQFLNSAFVHNPLLDAGGDIGVDRHGFTPGVRLSYLNHADKSRPWRLSLGVFGTGPGADDSRSFSAPMVIAQAETQARPMAGLPGNWRVYLWRNGQAPTYPGGSAARSGWGLSVDQRVGDTLTLFGRWGQHIQGAGALFDKALTAGFELAGSEWGRSDDTVGLAAGVVRSAAGFRADSRRIDLDGNGVPDYGYAARGSELPFELYYRWRLSRQFEITPSLQFIAHPGANPDAPAWRIVSLRVQLSY